MVPFVLLGPFPYVFFLSKLLLFVYHLVFLNECIPIHQKKKKRWTTLVNPMEKEKDNETSQKYIITLLICSCYVHPLLPNLYTISLVTIFFTTLFIIANMVCCDLWLVHNKSSVSGRRRWKWCCNNHKAIVKNIVSLASFICDIFIFYEIPVNIEKLRYFPVAH